MATILNPYLSFKDNARQAMEFYHGIFGGKLDVSTFGEFHMSEDSSEQNKVMHAQLATDNGLTLMASDTPTGMEYKEGSNCSISVSGEDEAELRGYWDGLAGGGTITVPMEKAPWGDTFGMLTDKFGVVWLININAAQQ